MTTLIFNRLRIGALAACLLASPLFAERKAEKVDLAPDRLPQAVIDAARKEVEGVAFTQARKLSRKGGAVYRIEGMVGDKACVFTINDVGRVLKVTRPKSGSSPDEAPYDGPFRLTGTIAHAPVRESSGIVASRRHAGIYWTHNDRGNAAVLYAIDRTGKVLNEYKVDASSDDWEDIAADDAGNLYIGNIGNNRAARASIEVHRLAEPEPAQARAAAPLRASATWRLRFPGKPFDCESLFIQKGHAYVVSKHFDGTPAAIYRFALEGPRDAVLQEVLELPVRSAVTAADLTADGKRLAVLSSAGLHLFGVDDDLRSVGEPKLIPVPAGKLEGICFSTEGLLMTSESRRVYLMPK